MSETIVHTADAPDRGSITGGEVPGLGLDGLTSYTIGVIRAAHTAGLRPAWGQPRGNARRIILNGPGPHSPFGSITIGTKTGKILRAQIIYGNDRGARRVNATGTNAVRTLIAGMVPSQCPEGCTAPNALACAHRSRDYDSARAVYEESAGKILPAFADDHDES